MLDRLRNPTRSTRWKVIRSVELAFNTHHLQGMARLGEVFYLSSVEVLEPPDGGPGRVRGHLFRFDASGCLRGSVVLGRGPCDQPGGLDSDGRHLWVPVAEYRPRRRSLICRVDPDTLRARVAFTVNDHVGALGCDVERGLLHGMSWRSRTFYTSKPDGTLVRSRAGAVITRNRTAVEVVDGRLRLCAVPDDSPSTLYMLEPARE